MVSALPNLTGQEDVYSVHATEYAPEASLPRAEIRVILESFPGALARVFALLCLFELVPSWVQASTSPLSREDIQLELGFDELQPHRLDLLLRKIRQLTECLDAQLSQNVTGADSAFRAATAGGLSFDSLA